MPSNTFSSLLNVCIFLFPVSKIFFYFIFLSFSRFLLDFFYKMIYIMYQVNGLQFVYTCRTTVAELPRTVSFGDFFILFSYEIYQFSFYFFA